MQSRMARSTTLLVLVALLVGLFPITPSVAAPSVQTSTPPPPPPSEIIIPPLPPVPPSRLPALTLEVATSANPIILNTTTIVTLTVTNAASDQADETELTFPIPAGVIALPGYATVGPAQGWRWVLGRLAPQSTLIVTGALRVEQSPPDAVLRLRPQITARGLSLSNSIVSHAALTAAILLRAAKTWSGITRVVRSVGKRAHHMKPANCAQSMSGVCKPVHGSWCDSIALTMRRGRVVCIPIHGSVRAAQAPAVIPAEHTPPTRPTAN